MHLPGVEPGAFRSGGGRSIQLSYRCGMLQEDSGLLQRAHYVLLAISKTHGSAPGGSRTPGLQIRSLALCPAELRARMWPKQKTPGSCGGAGGLLVGPVVRFYCGTPPATSFGRSCCSVPTMHFALRAMARTGIAVLVSVVAGNVVMPRSYRRSWCASMRFLWVPEMFA